MAGMRRLVRAWPWVIGGAVVVALLVQALGPEVLEVDIVEATRAPMRVTLDEEGRTRVRDVFTLTAPVTGTVSRITLEPGDVVTGGQAVATIRPASPALLDARTRTELRAQVEAARAALGQTRAEAASAEADARQAQADLQRMRPLASAGAIAAAALEQYELRARTADERHQAATFAVRVATHRLEAAQAAAAVGGSSASSTGVGAPLTLRAPVDGTVLRRVRVSEAVVPAGDVLLEMGDLSTLEVVADYLSTDAVQLRPGMDVLIEQWGGDVPLRGRIRRIEPAGFTKVSALGVEEQRVNVVVEPVDGEEAWRALGDGYRVEVRAVVWEAPDVLGVPLGSLFRHGERDWAVFVVEEGRAVLRPVQIGRQTDRSVQIVEGVRAGEEVIVHPGDRVSAGARVVGSGL
jgi:HlyD family secretion protein